MDVPKQPERELPRSIGVWGGAAIMIGVMIGTGIFATPPEIARFIPNPSFVLMLWVVGGMISLCGALIWAELSTMFPQSGGLYVFLREAYGPAVAFVFGWAFCLITQPMAVAAMALICVQHLFLLLGKSEGGGDIWFRYEENILTCAVIFFLTFLNVIGMKRGAGVAVLLTGLKTLALAAIVGIALVLMKGDTSNFTAQPISGSLWLAIVPAMAGILWTFDGWSDAAAVAEEVKEPNRKLPQVFILGTLGVTLLYVAVNAVYFWMLPLEAIQKTTTVAPLVMEKLLGNTGKVAVTVLIVISTLGSAQASIIIGSRVAFAQSRDGLLFRFFSHVHPTFKTPDRALWWLCVLSCILLWVLKEFEKLKNGFVFTAMIFYLAGAISLFVFRKRRPDAERPFRCWGYPVVPVIFIVFAIGLVVLEACRDPKHTLPYVGIILFGYPIYLAWRYVQKDEINGHE